MKCRKMMRDKGFQGLNKVTGRNAESFFTIARFYAIMGYIKQFRRIQDDA